MVKAPFFPPHGVSTVVGMYSGRHSPSAVSVNAMISASRRTVTAVKTTFVSGPGADRQEGGEKGDCGDSIWPPGHGKDPFRENGEMQDAHVPCVGFGHERAGIADDGPCGEIHQRNRDPHPCRKLLHFPFFSRNPRGNRRQCPASPAPASSGLPIRKPAADASGRPHSRKPPPKPDAAAILRRAPSSRPIENRPP